MYILKSVYWTFFIFHWLCLLPVVIWGYPLWKGSLKMPKRWQIGAILVAAVAFAVLTLTLYLSLGACFLNDASTLALLRGQGYRRGILIPMSLYFIIVNSSLEELFWRGVIMNKIDRLGFGARQFGLIWSSITYGFYHYAILRLVVYPGWAELGVFLLSIYGAMLAVVYRRTGSLIISTLVHALLTDLTAMLLMTALLIKLHQGLI